MELISKEVVRRIIDSGRTKEQMLGMLECVVTYGFWKEDSSTEYVVKFGECDDCISREAVLDLAKKGILVSNSNYKAVCNAIKALPSVKPKDNFEEVAEDIDMMEEDIDLACEALEEDDDCISRSEAIRIASGYCHWSRIPEELAKLPAVTPKDDCIGRKHLIGEIESLKKSPWFREGEKHKDGLMLDVEHLQYIARKEAVEIVMDLCIRKEKTVKPKERTGHWMAVYQGDEIINYRCSECEFGNTFGKSTYRMNYCPNCGARMTEIH